MCAGFLVGSIFAPPPPPPPQTFVSSPEKAHPEYGEDELKPLQILAAFEMHLTMK